MTAGGSQRRQPPPDNEDPPIYAVVGPTAATVAYNIAGIAARRARKKLHRTLLVDAEGSLSRGVLSGIKRKPTDDLIVGGLGDRLDPYLMNEPDSGLKALLHPIDDDQPADGLIQRLQREFDLIVVPCGASRYAANWIKRARSLAACGSNSRELVQAIQSIEHSTDTRQEAGLLLACMGDLELAEELQSYPTVQLPSSHNEALVRAERAGRFAAFADAGIGRDFEGLLDNLLRTEQRPAGKPPEPPSPIPSRQRRGWKEAPARAAELSAGPSRRDLAAIQSSSADITRGLYREAGEISQNSRVASGAERPEPANPEPANPESANTDRTDRINTGRDTLHKQVGSTPVQYTPAPKNNANKPPKSRLQKLRGGISALSGMLRRGGGDAGPEAGDGHEHSPEELERRLKLSLRETAVGGMSRVCVGSPKGGVGKSSIAYALAGSIAYYTNLRVCLVDADPNFGSTRLLVPRPVEHSVVSLAKDAEDLRGLSDIRAYVAQNERMRLDVVLGPEQASQMAALGDLGEAYGRIDAVLSRFYDLVIYDLGLGFRDPAIRHVLSLSDELLFITDSEVIPNAMLADAIRYVENLRVDLARTTLVLNHRLPPSDESALAPQVRESHSELIRRITEIPYDARMSQLLNQRSFHIEELSTPTRLGVLTTVAACLEGLRDHRGSAEKVMMGASPGANEKAG